MLEGAADKLQHDQLDTLIDQETRWWHAIFGRPETEQSLGDQHIFERRLTERPEIEIAFAVELAGGA